MKQVPLLPMMLVVFVLGSVVLGAVCGKWVRAADDEAAALKEIVSDLEQDLVDCQIQLRGAMLESDKRKQGALGAANMVKGEDVYLRCPDGERCSRIFLDAENRVQIEPYTEEP